MAQLADGTRATRATLPAAVGAGVALGFAAAFSSLGLLVGVTGLSLGYLLLLAPEGGILLILLLRPVMDLAPEGLSVPGFGNVLDLSAIVALLLAGTGAIYVMSRRIDIFRIPLALPFAALLAVSAATLPISSDPGLTAASLARLMGQFMLFVLVFSILRRRAQVERLVAVLVVSAVPPVLWGFGQILTGNAKFLNPALAGAIDHPRLAAPFGEGLTLGTFLIVPLVLLVVLFFESRRPGGRLFYGGLLAFFLVAFFMTLARGPWVGFAVALGVLGIARYRVLLPLILVAVALLLVLVPSFGQRLAPVALDPEQTTVAGRLNLWEGALTVYSEHPVLGAGFGAAAAEAGIERRGRVANFHSDYLRVLADIGPIGLATYLWLLGAAGLEGLRALRRLKTPRYRAIVLSFLAVWAAFLVVRISGNVLTHQVYQYYIWALAAVALALPQLEGMDESAMDDRIGVRSELVPGERSGAEGR